MSDHELPLRRVILRRQRNWVSWLLLALLAGGVAAFIWYAYLPLRAERSTLEQRVLTGDKRADGLERKLSGAQAALGELETAQKRLSGELTQTQAEKETLEAELQRLQGELTAKLEPEIQAGNVKVVRRGNDLVVDLADQILFEPGKPEVHDDGKNVLGQVAPTLARLKDFTIQVAGHTDSTRVTNPKTQKRFETNWELSTARATNVVRFLQEDGKVAGEHLAAVGYAQFRPASSNASADGRRKNRRIELVLIRK
jgi:chemotaxis protein MotB